MPQMTDEVFKNDRDGDKELDFQVRKLGLGFRV